MNTKIESLHGGRPDRESGNALWFILLAIALMAALTITLSRSSDTGGSAGNQERDRVQASEIMRYASGIERTIEQMIMRGVGESQLSFENDFVSGYQSTRCPNEDDPCRVFGRNGGAQSYLTPRESWLDGRYSAEALYGEWFITGDVCVQDIGTGGTGCEGDGDTANEDLVMFLPWVSEGICTQINSLLNMTATAPTETGDAWPGTTDRFQGSFGDDTILNQAGERTGCFEGSGANTPPDNSFHFYHVLIER